MNGLRFAVATVAAALLLSSGAIAQPSVGDIFDAPPSVQPNAFDWRFRGWQYHARGAAIGMGRFVIFKNGPSYLIAATEVVTPSRGYSHDGIQRIVAIRTVTPSAGEVEAVSCDFVTLSPALALYANGIARGFFVVGEEIVERRWFVDRGDCYQDPD